MYELQHDFEWALLQDADIEIWVVIQINHSNTEKVNLLINYVNAHYASNTLKVDSKIIE